MKDDRDHTATPTMWQLQFGLELMKTMVLINAGAVVALLTFVGHAEATKKDLVVPGLLLLALAFYGIGLASAVRAGLVQHLNQVNWLRLWLQGEEDSAMKQGMAGHDHFQRLLDASLAFFALASLLAALALYDRV